VFVAVADAMRDAATTASAHAARVKQSASEAAPKALEAISHAFHTGSYVLAYGVVYAAVFIAHSLPQENPVMSGLRDGGRAAIDELGADWADRLGAVSSLSSRRSSLSGPNRVRGWYLSLAVTAATATCACAVLEAIHGIL
jgi:hypothetical protein